MMPVMHLATGLLIAYMITDFLPVAPSTVPEAVSAYNQTGAGELTVIVENQGTVGSVPKGATRIEFLTLNLSASCEGPVTVNEIDVKHLGLGSLDDISGVYLSDGLRRMTRAARFERSGAVARLRLKSFVVPKCDGVRLTVFADFSSGAATAGEHGMTVASADAVLSSAKAVTLSQSRKIDVKVATPKEAGVITVNFLPIASRLRYGHIETVARLQLTADSKNDHLLKRITFTNAESARDMDLQNVVIQTTSGKQLTTTAARMRGKQVALDFTPSYVLRRSSTVVLLLKAEVRASVTRKVNFTLEEAADLEAKIYIER